MATMLEMANDQVLALIAQGFVTDETAPLTTERIYNKLLELSQRTTVADLRKSLETETSVTVESKPTQSNTTLSLTPYGIHRNHITCLECGRNFKALGTHLWIHDLTAVEYKERNKIPKSVKLASRASSKRYAESGSVAWRKPLEDWEISPTYRHGRQWADITNE